MPVRRLDEDERPARAAAQGVYGLETRALDRYLAGSRAILRITWRDGTGDLVFPTEVSCAVRSPSGRVQTLDAVPDAEGFRAEVDADEPGFWRYCFEAKGASRGRYEHAFYVRERRL